MRGAISLPSFFSEIEDIIPNKKHKSDGHTNMQSIGIVMMWKLLFLVAIKLLMK